MVNKLTMPLDQCSSAPAAATSSVAKAGVPAQIQKRTHLVNQINKQTTALARSGRGATAAAGRQFFKADRHRYNHYRP